jgi:ABC-type transport system substrate-binding protein
MTKVEIRRRPAPFSLPLLLISSIILLQTESGCRRGGAPGEMAVMLEKRIETFDPRVSGDTAVERMRQLMFNGLTRKDDKFEPAPDLAENYEQSPDYKTFTFHLRPNVKFHNRQALSSATSNTHSRQCWPRGSNRPNGLTWNEITFLSKRTPPTR